MLVLLCVYCICVCPPAGCSCVCALVICLLFGMCSRGCMDVVVRIRVVYIGYKC